MSCFRFRSGEDRTPRLVPCLAGKPCWQSRANSEQARERQECAAAPEWAGEITFFAPGSWLQVGPLLLSRFGLAARMIPLFRLLPDVISQRKKRGLNRRYGELKFLEKDLAAGTLRQRRAPQGRRTARPDRADSSTTSSRSTCSSRVYTLRQHVDFVRGQLNRQTAT